MWDRISRRVDQMMDQGLVREVRSLLDRGVPLSCTAMQAIGYKEMAAALRGGGDVCAAAEEIKLRSRQYAKRQLTWFRREPGTVWVNKDEFGYDENKMLEYMLSVCHEKGITGE